MKKVFVLLICLVTSLMISGSFALATKEAKSVKKVKKVTRPKQVKGLKITTDKNKVLKTKQLEILKERSTISTPSSIEYAPPMNPQDVHPSTQF